MKVNDKIVQKLLDNKPLFYLVVAPVSFLASAAVSKYICKNEIRSFKGIFNSVFFSFNTIMALKSKNVETKSVFFSINLVNILLNALFDKKTFQWVYQFIS